MIFIFFYIIFVLRIEFFPVLLCIYTIVYVVRVRIIIYSFFFVCKRKKIFTMPIIWGASRRTYPNNGKTPRGRSPGCAGFDTFASLKEIADTSPTC